MFVFLACVCVCAHIPWMFLKRLGNFTWTCWVWWKKYWSWKKPGSTGTTWYYAYGNYPMISKGVHAKCRNLAMKSQQYLQDVTHIAPPSFPVTDATCKKPKDSRFLGEPINNSKKTPTYPRNIPQTLNHLFMVWKSFHICSLGYRLGMFQGLEWKFLRIIQTFNYSPEFL